MRSSPGGVELVPAATLSPARLAELFTAGYEGYQVPIRVDESAFVAMAEVSDLDLDRSRVALRDGEPVGIGVLGVRGGAGWIGGLGVVAAERRRGVGLTLMESLLAEARAGGIERVTLEVLEPNRGAIALYERLGFEPTRMLEVWTLEAEAPTSAALPAGVDAAHGWIRAHRQRLEPWQRADESLAHLRRRGEPEAVALGDEGAALLRAADGGVSLLQLGAADERVAAELVGAARARGTTLRYVNVPEGDPASAALRGLGARLDVRQVEMALPLLRP